MKKHISLLHTIAACALAIPSAMFAQQIALNNDMPNSPTASSAAPATTLIRPATSAPATPRWETGVDRWLDLDTFTYASRYRSTFDVDGAHTFNQGQQRLIADGKFKFDQQGRYGIGFHLSSGRYFNWSYADFIGGGQHQFLANSEAKMTPYQLYFMLVSPPAQSFYNSGGGQLYLRQLFLTVQPIQGAEVQFGGLSIQHGVNSEATSYDDDGYITGERISVKRPKQLWLSDISYTRGYEGDIYTPNFFARADTLSRSNYWQILAEKDFAKRVAVSADYTFVTPITALGHLYSLKTTREAIFANVHESKVFDTVRFEAYQRLNGGSFAPDNALPFPDGKGYALTVGRDFKKRFSVEGGFADIDLMYVSYLGIDVQAVIMGLSVNGDQYGIGKRYFVRPSIPLTHYLSLTGNFSHIYDTTAAAKLDSLSIWNAQVFSAGFVIDAKKLLFHSPAVH